MNDSHKGIVIALLFLTMVSFVNADIHDGLQVLWQNFSKPVTPDFTYYGYNASVHTIWSLCPSIIDPTWNAACFSAYEFPDKQIKSVTPVNLPIEDGFTVSMTYYSTKDDWSCGSYCDMYGYGPFLGQYSNTFPPNATFLMRKNWNDESTLIGHLRFNNGSTCQANFAGGGSFYAVRNHTVTFSYDSLTGNLSCLHNGVSCGSTLCSALPLYVHPTDSYIGPGGIAQGGGIQELRFNQFAVWDRVLSDDEKLSLYNNAAFLPLNETFRPFDPYAWAEKNISSYDDYYEHYYWNNPLYAYHVAITDIDGPGVRNDVLLQSEDYGFIFFENVNNTWSVSDPYQTIDATYTDVTDMQVGDFNEDDCIDIAFIDPGTAPPKWLPSICEGNFDPAESLPNNYTTYYSHTFDALGMGDVNGDTHLDLVSHSYICPNQWGCAGSEAYYIFMWLNDGAGNFVQYHIHNTTNIPKSFAIVDWNKDGNEDIIVGGHDGVCTFLTNDGSEVFTRTTLSNCGQEISMADINNDTYYDIVVSRASDVAWLENVAGTGSWTAHVVPGHDGGYYGAQAVAADFNFDNKLDIVSIDSNAWKLFYSLNNGTGLLWSGPYDLLKPNYNDHYNEWGGLLYDMAVGDITDDGINEVITAGEFPFIFFNENTPSSELFCTPSWSCNGYTSCYLNDTRECNSVTDLNSCGETYTGDYSEFPIQSCDYCTPSWSCSAYNSSCGPDDNYPCINATDSNNCYALTGLLNDTYTGDYSEFPGTGSCDYCLPNWYCNNDLCQDTSYGTRCLITIGEPYWMPQYCQPNNLYICSNAAVNDSNQCYAQTGLPSDNNPPILYQNVSCNYCTPSVSYVDYKYPTNEYCSDSGLQYRTFTNTNWASCCDTTNLTEDCYVPEYIPGRDLDFTNTNIIQDQLTCEKVFWMDAGVSYKDIEEPYIWSIRSNACRGTYNNSFIMNYTQLGSSFRFISEFNGAYYSGYRVGMRVDQKNLYLPNYWWYYTRNGDYYSYANIYSVEDADTFNLTSTSKIQLDVIDANQTLTYLSFQDVNGTNGFYIPITVNGNLAQDGCTNASLFEGEPGNSHNIVCCDYGRSTTNTSYRLDVSMADLTTHCPALDSSHYQNLKIIQFKGYGSNNGYLHYYKNLTILPYDGFNISSTYNKEPVIQTVDRTWTPKYVPQGTKVNFTINAVDLEGSPLSYYINCDYNPTLENEAWYNYGFWEITTSGGLDALRNQPITPTASKVQSCTFSLLKNYTVRVFAYDAGMQVKHQISVQADGLLYTPETLPFPYLMKSRALTYYTMNPGYSVYQTFNYTTIPDICGDEICSQTENYLTCPSDCNSYCGDGICNTQTETYYSCQIDCTTPPTLTVPSGPGPAPDQGKEEQQELLYCTPGYQTIYDEQFLTEYKEVAVENLVREKVSELTCGIDANQDGLSCDPNEDFISCSEDCKLNIGDVLCLGDKCIFTEAWFLKIFLILMTMLSLYLTYTLYLT